MVFIFPARPVFVFLPFRPVLSVLVVLSFLLIVSLLPDLPLINPVSFRPVLPVLFVLETAPSLSILSERPLLPLWNVVPVLPVRMFRSFLLFLTDAVLPVDKAALLL